jgi:hypothetical protein
MIQTLHSRHRQFDQMQIVLDHMRRGAVLHLEIGGRGHRWRLTGGMPVADRIARMVLQDPHVVIIGTSSQTFRWVG